MIHLCAFLLVLAPAPALPAEPVLHADPVFLAELGAQDPKSAAAERAYDAVAEEYDGLEKAFYDALKKAKTDEERSEIAETKRPDAKVFVARFRKVADEHPRTESAARALVWIVLHARGQDAGKDALDVLLRDHIASASLADVCYDLSFADDSWVGPALERIAKDAPAAEVRGKALYSLATHRQRVARLARRLRDDSDAEARELQRKSTDAKRLAELDALDPAHLDKEAEEILERVAKEYADVLLFKKKLGAWAEGGLFEMRNLAIGKTAPDIEAEDVDGVPFKLSDYRGKVVVLDFWGHW